jgi:hypothetical protein
MGRQNIVLVQAKSIPRAADDASVARIERTRSIRVDTSRMSQSD